MTSEKYYPAYEEERLLLDKATGRGVEAEISLPKAGLIAPQWKKIFAHVP